MHPTRRQIFAGKTDSTFWNIWPSDHESYRVWEVREWRNSLHTSISQTCKWWYKIWVPARIDGETVAFCHKKRPKNSINDQKLIFLAVTPICFIFSLIILQKLTFFSFSALCSPKNRSIGQKSDILPRSPKFCQQSPFVALCVTTILPFGPIILSLFVSQLEPFERRRPFFFKKIFTRPHALWDSVCAR